MSFTPVGWYVFELRVDILTDPHGGGGHPPVADGDWIFWFIYYPHNTWTPGSPSGFTRIRQTSGSLGTVELWRRQWHTGDPTTWPINRSGGSGWDFLNPDQNVTTVWRNVVGTPGTLISTTHETTSPPILVDAITDVTIGNNDTALQFCATNKGTPASTGVNVGGDPGVSARWAVVPSAGAAPSASVSYTGTTPTDMFGLQVILADVPIPPPGGWSVGQIRMNH